MVPYAKGLIVKEQFRGTSSYAFCSRSTFLVRLLAGGWQHLSGEHFGSLIQIQKIRAVNLKVFLALRIFIFSGYSVPFAAVII